MEHIHVEAEIFLKARRDAGGRFHGGVRAVAHGFFGALDTLFDFADAGEILVELFLVARREAAGAAAKRPRSGL